MVEGAVSVIEDADAIPQLGVLLNGGEEAGRGYGMINYLWVRQKV